MDDKASSIRWQQITIDQLTYASNLNLTFIVASIAFEVSSNLHEPLTFSNCIFKVSFVLSLILFCISFVISMLLIVNRLRDFRDTASIARLREESKNTDQSLPARRFENKKIGQHTWHLFYAQLITFGIGMTLAVIAFSDFIF